MPGWVLPAAIAAGNVAANIYGNVSGNKQSREEAARNRAFQERMSNTGFQRAKADMIKAGMNPAAMYGSAGAASSPSGSTATQRSPTEGLSQSVSTALQVKKLHEELKLLQATTRRVDEEGRVTRVERFKAEDFWGRMNVGTSRLSSGEEIPNARDLQAYFEAKFDERVSTTEAQKLRNILMQLQQPGAEASARLMQEIEKLPPKLRMALLMMLGAQRTGGN